MARPDHRQVDGQDQHGRADRLGARHQILREAAVAHHVELKPRRRGRGLRHLLDATDRDGRLDERHARRLRGPRGLHLGSPREHPGEADRRQHDRERQSLAQHLDRGIANADVAHHDLAQQHGLEIGDVGTHRRLLIRAAVYVVEQLTRQPAARQLAVVEHRRRGDAKRAIGTEAHRRPILSQGRAIPHRRCASSGARSTTSTAPALFRRVAVLVFERVSDPLLALAPGRFSLAVQPGAPSSRSASSTIRPSGPRT